MEDNFPMDGECMSDGFRMLPVNYTIVHFISLYQLHLRSSGINLRGRGPVLNSVYSFLSSDIVNTDSEKAMAPHSSTLAWKIPWMEEPGGLQSIGSQRVGHD